MELSNDINLKRFTVKNGDLKYTFSKSSEDFFVINDIGSKKDIPNSDFKDF